MPLKNQWNEPLNQSDYIAEKKIIHFHFDSKRIEKEMVIKYPNQFFKLKENIQRDIRIEEKHVQKIQFNDLDENLIKNKINLLIVNPIGKIAKSSYSKNYVLREKDVKDLIAADQKKEEKRWIPAGTKVKVKWSDESMEVELTGKLLKQSEVGSQGEFLIKNNKKILATIIDSENAIIHLSAKGL